MYIHLNIPRRVRSTCIAYAIYAIRICTSTMYTCTFIIKSYIMYFCMGFYYILCSLELCSKLFPIYHIIRCCAQACCTYTFMYLPCNEPEYCKINNLNETSLDEHHISSLYTIHVARRR